MRDDAFRNVLKNVESVNKAALALSVDCLIWIFCCETELELGENPMTLTQREQFQHTWENLAIVLFFEVTKFLSCPNQKAVLSNRDHFDD